LTNKIKSFLYFNISEIFYLINNLYIGKKQKNNLIYSRFILENLLRKSYKITKQRDNLIINNFQGLNFSLRKNSSDFQVFQQIMIDEEYDAVIQILQKNKIEIKTMVDCGANVGLSTLYLKAKYPEAKIIALEADVNNTIAFENNVNINSLKQIHVLNNEIWTSNKPLIVKKDFRDGNNWSFTVEESNSSENYDVQGINFDYLIKKYDLKSIDFLKIDIEGGERFLFDGKHDLTSILSITKCIAIEIHDEFNIREDIYKILKSHHFTLTENKELTIGLKLKNEA
jgi:FkbM family methyltransferase